MSYYPPTRNFKCNNKSRDLNGILEECSAKNNQPYSNFKIHEKPVAEGSYGKVYTGSVEEYSLNNKSTIEHKVAVKEEFVYKSENMNKVMDDFVFGAEYSYYMGEVGIGPKVFNSFFIENYLSIVQYTIMEAMDVDCSKILKSNEISRENKIFTVKEMIRLLKKQVLEYDLLCTDIKPQNYIAKLHKKSVEKVRMIDFGNFCRVGGRSEILKYVEEKNRKEIFLLTQLIQLYFFVDYINHDLLEPFYKEALFGVTCAPDFLIHLDRWFHDEDLNLQYYYKSLNNINENDNIRNHYKKIINSFDCLDEQAREQFRVYYMQTTQTKNLSIPRKKGKQNEPMSIVKSNVINEPMSIVNTFKTANETIKKRSRTKSMSKQSIKKTKVSGGKGEGFKGTIMKKLRSIFRT